MATDQIAAKLFSLLPATVRARADLRGGSIALGRGASVVVGHEGISILSNYDAACEHLGRGLSYRTISDHIAAVAQGTATSALKGSEVVMASGSGWVAA